MSPNSISSDLLYLMTSQSIRFTVFYVSPPPPAHCNYLDSLYLTSPLEHYNSSDLLYLMFPPEHYNYSDSLYLMSPQSKQVHQIHCIWRPPKSIIIMQFHLFDVCTLTDFRVSWQAESLRTSARTSKRSRRANFEWPRTSSTRCSRVMLARLWRSLWSRRVTLAPVSWVSGSQFGFSWCWY